MGIDVCRAFVGGYFLICAVLMGGLTLGFMVSTRNSLYGATPDFNGGEGNLFKTQDYYDNGGGATYAGNVEVGADTPAWVRFDPVRKNFGLRLDFGKLFDMKACTNDTDAAVQLVWARTDYILGGNPPPTGWDAIEFGADGCAEFTNASPNTTAGIQCASPASTYLGAYAPSAGNGTAAAELPYSYTITVTPRDAKEECGVGGFLAGALLYICIGFLSCAGLCCLSALGSFCSAYRRDRAKYDVV
eukprot:CAMPEP_0198307396 /NCGR_PEP_ID=MMETSP1450-20131203/287_1 /TAXON_ID=753684 ORGANISM="Madagascaria erythrocladiodes, Strain CCMP3234" /NCGR_SAMPLE_ID=MMETSP1450 /ASSEMBLY_ACC=CAM_ASM_001115 /LENGTH=244 /DNA_ID=CAMNT_0044009975 /DNA_START=63 /DNA_END=797 /DNA_ORIENTATION=-